MNRFASLSLYMRESRRKAMAVPVFTFVQGIGRTMGTVSLAL